MIAPSTEKVSLPEPDGVHLGISWDEYRKSERINPSTLKAGRLSMKHMLHAITSEDVDTPAKLLGRVTHTAILENDLFKSSVAVFKGDKRKKQWKEFQEANAHKEIISEDQYENLIGMANAVAAEPKALKAVEGCQPEVTLYANDHGVACKGRMDAWKPRRITDLKTAARIDMRQFGRDAERMGYHISLGMYRRWARLLTGEDHRVTIVVVETSEPYDVVVYPVADAILDSGEEMGVALLQRYKASLASGEWPGVAGGDHADLIWPEWAMDSEVAFAG